MKTVGKQLQEAREAKDWSPELAARETKIKIERLRDLEADDFSNFSSPTYARGFVRTYARSLGLDEYKLLRQLDNKLPEDDNASFANDSGVPYMPEPSQVSTPYRFGTGVYVAMGAGLTVLFLIAFILFQSYRAGYFAKVLPAPAVDATTNAVPTVPDSDQVTRALPADSNAAPVALPVDASATSAVATADGGTNAAPVAQPVNPVAQPVNPAVAPVAAEGTNAPAALAANSAPAANAATTPLDTKTPPRALPVDLNAIAATPDSTATMAAATNAAPVAAFSTNASTVAALPVTPAPSVVAAPTPAPQPEYRPPPSLSARDSNQRPAAAPSVPKVTVSSAPPTIAPPVTPLTAVPAATPPAPATVLGSSETTTAAPDAATTTLAATQTASAPDAAPALTGEAPAASPAVATPDSHAVKRLVLTASHDSYIRVVSLDDPSGQQVRFASVLHEGQSISFSDRKYSINVGVPSAVDILLDGINYGPHSDHSEPDTFVVESRQP
jgi:cytoskeleton protein RodZ